MLDAPWIVLAAPSRCMHRDCAEDMLCRGAKAPVWRLVLGSPAWMVPGVRPERHTARQISLRCGIGVAGQTGTEPVPAARNRACGRVAQD
ncbi:hypothetical protein GCM10009079_32330 [Ralstonia mannitolilytica]